MGHMVIFQGGDGKPGYHQVDDLDEAIQHVEHLRNDEGVEQARIFHTEEVAFEFRPYFRVEVGGAAAATEQPAAEAPAPVRPRTSPWTRPLEQAPEPQPALVEAAVVEPQPLEAALKAIVGEPAGEPRPEDGSAPEAPAANDGLSANGARRGLFGR